jgi:hypothetical protein
MSGYSEDGVGALVARLEALATEMVKAFGGDERAAEPVAMLEAAAALTALAAERDEAIEARDEAVQGPWPEWALKIEKLLRDRGAYDGWTDEYDLPNDLAEHIEGYEKAVEDRDARREATLLALGAEFDRLSLVIESAVRNQDPAHSAAVIALINANRAALSKATSKWPLIISEVECRDEA